MVYSGCGIAFDGASSCRNEGPIYDINSSFSSPENFCINFSKENTKFYFELTLQLCWLVNLDFSARFCLGSISNKFSGIDSREVL